MKITTCIIFFLALVIGRLTGADAVPPALPTEIALVGGQVLRGVTVTRWERTRITVKYVGGVAPVQFIHMAPESRKVFEAARDRMLPSAEAERTAQAEAAKEAAAVDQAIRDRAVRVGMTPEQVVRSWGEPIRRNTSGGSTGAREQWVYANTYLYFDSGRLTSWQRSQ